MSIPVIDCNHVRAAFDTKTQEPLEIVLPKGWVYNSDTGYAETDGSGLEIVYQEDIALIDIGGEQILAEDVLWTPEG